MHAKPRWVEHRLPATHSPCSIPEPEQTFGPLPSATRWGPYQLLASLSLAGVRRSHSPAPVSRAACMGWGGGIRGRDSPSSSSPVAATALLQPGSCPAFYPMPVAGPSPPIPGNKGESETESESQGLGGRRKMPAREMACGLTPASSKARELGAGEIKMV